MAGFLSTKHGNVSGAYNSSKVGLLSSNGASCQPTKARNWLVDQLEKQALWSTSLLQLKDALINFRESLLSEKGFSDLSLSIYSIRYTDMVCTCILLAAPFQWVMSWRDMIGSHHYAVMLDQQFFPKWLQVLSTWLTNSPNFDEVTKWWGFLFHLFLNIHYIFPREDMCTCTYTSAVCPYFTDGQHTLVASFIPRSLSAFQFYTH